MAIASSVSVRRHWRTSSPAEHAWGGTGGLQVRPSTYPGRYVGCGTRSWHFGRGACYQQDKPSNIEDYVHRIGRTVRCGNIRHAMSIFWSINRLPAGTTAFQSLDGCAAGDSRVARCDVSRYSRSRWLHECCRSIWSHGHSPWKFWRQFQWWLRLFTILQCPCRRRRWSLGLKQTAPSEWWNSSRLISCADVLVQVCTMLPALFLLQRLEVRITCGGNIADIKATDSCCVSFVESV